MGSTETNLIRRLYEDHIVIFPFPSKGHVIPLLHFSAALSAKDGVKVTIITTLFTSAFIHDFLHLPKPNVHVQLIDFPSPAVTSLPPGVESTDQLPSFDLFPSFLHATALLDTPFHKVVQTMVEVDDDVPLCVISDFFCLWTDRTCREFGIPRIVFHGLGVFSLSFCKALFQNMSRDPGFEAEVTNGSEFYVPGTPENMRLRISDVPGSILKFRDDPVSKFLSGTVEEERHSWGVLVNSFDALEKDYVSHVESFYSGEAKAWLVGPLCLYSTRNINRNTTDNNDNSSLMEWLEAEGSPVLYVSFGTMVFWQKEQLDEIWHGLEMSGYDYLWVVRSSEWEPPAVKREGKKQSTRGLLYRGWVSQMEILRHPAVGGFMSHCGWNSVLESVAAEVPILAWPVIAEQTLNTKFIVDIVGIALRLTAAREGMVVGREIICKGVKELMGGQKGKKAREKMAETGRAARVAAEEGGSSWDTLNKLLKDLRVTKESKRNISHTSK